MLAFFKYRTLRQPRILRRIFVERLTEPIHLHALSALVALAGSYRMKIAFDLIHRSHNAYGILSAADQARALGIPEIRVLEFGVAAGAGLMNMSRIGARVERLTGVKIRIFGFDTGAGMPPPVDYRDHPDQYWEGCFPMPREALRRRLPPNASLVLGDLEDTVAPFLREVTERAPIGYAAIDLDYYSSTTKALKAFTDEPAKYLPCTYLYLDDIAHEYHNRWCGELLAVDEFNARHVRRKIEPDRFLRGRRIMKNAPWLDQIFILHVLDHPRRQPSAAPKGTIRVLDNPFL